MPAVPSGIAAYVRRRGPLAGRGASARFVRCLGGEARAIARSARWYWPVSARRD